MSFLLWVVAFFLRSYRGVAVFTRAPFHSHEVYSICMPGVQLKGSYHCTSYMAKEFGIRRAIILGIVTYCSWKSLILLVCTHITRWEGKNKHLRTLCLPEKEKE